MRERRALLFLLVLCTSLSCFTLGSFGLGHARSVGSALEPSDSDSSGVTRETYIVAAVDDAPITSFDLSQRLRIANLAYLHTGGFLGADSPPGDLRQEAFRSLVEEKIIRRLAIESDLSISDTEVDQGIQALARQDGSDTDQLKEALKRGGVEYGSFREKVRSQLLWQKIVAQKVAPRLEVSPDEIKAELRQMAEKNKDVYTLVRIVFSLPQEAELLEVMQRRQDVERFSRSFSTCDDLRDKVSRFSSVEVSSPQRIPLAQMEPNMRRAVQSIRRVSLTEPVRSYLGFELLAVCRYQKQVRLPDGRSFIEQVKDGIEMRKLEALSEQYLRTLRDKQRSHIVIYDKTLHP